MTRRAIYARVSPFFFPLFRPRTLSSFPPRAREFRTLSGGASPARDRGLARRYYTSVDGRIPGRRDACTDCVELAAPSSESRERRRDARRDGTRSNSHGAGPQDYTVSLFFFPTDSPSSLSLSLLPLPLALSHSLSPLSPSSFLISFSLSSYRSRHWI